MAHRLHTTRRMTTRRRPSSRGFTLIEIVIVAAIIGVAAALAGYNFNRLRERNQLRGMVREVVGLVNEARGTAVVLSGAIVDRRVVDTNNDCPAAFTQGAPAGSTPVPGLALNVNANPRLTTAVVIDRMVDRAPNGALAPPMNRLPTIDIDCRTEPLGAIYQGSAIASSAGLTTAGTTVLVGFDGRGMTTSLTGGLVGRIVITEANSGETQTVLVNGGGQACIEGPAGRCSSGR